MSVSEQQKIRQAFGNAHISYDSVAQIQRDIANQLLALLPNETTANTVLDAGCGTGFGIQLLRQHSATQNSRFIALDFAYNMVRHVEADYKITANLCEIPLRAHSVDLYWSNLAWQWADTLQALREAHRVLMSKGLLCITTLGEHTLQELKRGFSHSDSAQHVREFPPSDLYAEWLMENGFELVNQQRIMHRIYFDNLKQLFLHLKALGAHTVGTGRRRSLLGKNAWQRLQDDYETYREPQRGLPATYDAIYLIAKRI